MRCLYCGTEYWLPSRIRRDPDFCSADHREKYNHRMDLALRRIQESPAPSLPEPMTARAAECGAARTESAAEVVSSFPAASPRAEVPEPSAIHEIPPVSLPRFAARPIFERVEEQDRPPEPREEEPAFTQIFSMSGGLPASEHKAERYAIVGTAAAVTVVLALWFAVGSAKSGRVPPNQSVVQVAASSNTEAHPEPGSFRHPMSWLRIAASQRAASHLADNFDEGMAAWGMQAKGWAPGWTHSPEGYVHPGRLALFQPTLHYANYRMDFLGQIENNGMSWAVRGKDAQNYYAMTARILRPGLRPVLSMAHYPVVQGEPGHMVELPLSVMIHNGVTYHVSVEVYGSHYRVFIEGEEVDSWSDDTLPTGGVGFFSEAGERARIYWVQVSRNDDWLGWLCGHIAAHGEVHETARFKHAVPLLLPAFVTTTRSN